MAEYIDRETAISLIKQYGKDAIDGGRYSLGTVDDCIELANRIKALPAADVAPVVHGRWIRRERGDEIFANYECSICTAYPTGGIRSNYCPNCGAKMDGGGNDGNV